MNILEILKPLSRDQLKSLSRDDLIELVIGEQSIRQQLEARNEELKEERILIENKYVLIKKRLFSPSSERSGRPRKPSHKPNMNQGHKGRKLRPSERYPDAEIEELDVELEQLPYCSTCDQQMHKTGVTDIREQLTVIPKKYMITRHHYHKYGCKNCHGSLITAPTLPRIKAGSSYSDEMIIDVSLSKYCDLIPIERYATMAKRSGFAGIPPQSLIELTHYLANFLKPIYKLIRNEVLSAKVLHADETVHRMLEGDERKRWYLWGFSSETASYFECHPTRSGDVATELLKDSKCRYLVTDIFSGYIKAIKETNVWRTDNGLDEIIASYCNAHARRKFWEIIGDDGDRFIDKYETIYKVEAEVKNHSPPEKLKRRQQMRPMFEQMYTWCQELSETNSEKSGQGRAAQYFAKNYEGLTRLLEDGDVPIDNNRQERQLRNPVVGRKTWSGTHSKRGAETAVILFSIVESCKLVHLNPRQYFRQIVDDMHKNIPPYSPAEAAKRLKSHH